MGKYVFGLVFLAMLMSCGEDIDIFIPRTNQGETGNISRLTTKLKQDIAGDIHHTISCPCFGDQAFEIDKDLVLVIPPGFVDVSQYPCENGFFTLDITVCDTRGEILIAGIPTLSENKLLDSRIEFNIQIKDGDQSIPLAQGKKIRVLVKDPDPRERMELFYGDVDDWKQADENPDIWSNVIAAEWWIQQDSSGGNPIAGFGYEAFSDSLDWINVDMFVDVPESQRTAVCVQLPEGFTNINSQVFMVFKDVKSVVGMDGDSTLKQFCEGHRATPLNYRVTFVVISERGEGIYYFAKQDGYITPDMTVSLSPKRTPYDEIKNFISHL